MSNKSKRQNKKGQRRPYRPSVRLVPPPPKPAPLGAPPDLCAGERWRIVEEDWGTLGLYGPGEVTIDLSYWRYARIEPTPTGAAAGQPGWTYHHPDELALDLMWVDAEGPEPLEPFLFLGELASWRLADADAAMLAAWFRHLYDRLAAQGGPLPAVTEDSSYA
jgi:hypothetical protein